MDSAELLAWLDDADRKRVKKAIRSVREHLTTAFHPEEDKGVLETQRPRYIARFLAGHMDIGIDLFELMWAREHFVELGQKIGPFYNEFVAARKEAKRGETRYVPADEELEAAFGDDWTVVRDAWPAIPFLVHVLALRANPLMSEEDQIAREEACWIEAEAFLAVLYPNKVEEGNFIDFVRRKVSELNKKTDDRPGLVNEVLKYVFAEPAGLRQRLLVYMPRGSVEAVLRYWTRAFKNAARDAVGPRTLGRKDGEAVTRDPSTLRRWSLEDRRRAQPGAPPAQIEPLNRALENDARMKHIDSTGSSLTLTQFARKQGVSESGARNALKRAIRAGALSPPQRLPGSTSYALRPADERVIQTFLGSPRSRKEESGYTIQAAAREAGVPVRAAIDYIKRLGDEPERIISSKKAITAEVYEFLVDALREKAPGVATTGGSAKPRTS